jgi:hypothetical protein
MSTDKMQNWLDVIDELRSAGYAVCVFSPDELGDADPDRVEDRLCELGWDVISSFN